MGSCRKMAAVCMALFLCATMGCKRAANQTPAAQSPAVETQADPNQTITYSALAPGDSEEAVTELQNRLLELQFFNKAEATGYYGSITTEAVRLFERTNGLPMDGIADCSMLTLLYSDQAKKYRIEQGNSGTDVTTMQQRLKKLYYLNASATGYFGTATEAALKAFQKRNGLDTDGIAGQATLDLLYSSKAKAAASSSGGVSSKITSFLAYAKAQLGKKYVSGNEGPNSFDCSGFIYYCLKHSGVNVGRLTAAGFSGVSKWKSVKKSDLKPGDILFFGVSGSSRVGHTGIYLGDGKMIHCSSGQGKVVIVSLSASYWVKNYKSAKRAL